MGPLRTRWRGENRLRVHHNNDDTEHDSEGGTSIFHELFQQGERRIYLNRLKDLLVRSGSSGLWGGGVASARYFAWIPATIRMVSFIRGDEADLWHSLLRHGVVAPCTPRMAATETAHCQHASVKESPRLDRIKCVARAIRDKATLGSKTGEERGESDLVGPVEPPHKRGASVFAPPSYGFRRGFERCFLVLRFFHRVWTFHELAPFTFVLEATTEASCASRPPCLPELDRLRARTSPNHAIPPPSLPLPSNPHARVW